MTPMTPIETTKVANRTTASRRTSSIAPVKPRKVRKLRLTKAPTMNMSPWAKLMSSMMP